MKICLFNLFITTKLRLNIIKQKEKKILINFYSLSLNKTYFQEWLNIDII